MPTSEPPDLFSEAMLERLVAKLGPKLIDYINRHQKPIEKMALNTRTAAYVLDTTTDGLERMLREGRLPAVRNGKTGRKISVKAIQEFIDKNTYYATDVVKTLKTEPQAENT
jgi:excisionase family DNA binding protein